MNKRRFIPATLLGFTVSSLVILGGCSTGSSQPLAMGTGANPHLPEPHQKLIPTVKIAPAVGWPADKKTVAITGTKVVAFAKGLDHPRWLYVLPNGDVLVAETNAPPSPMMVKA